MTSAITVQRSSNFKTCSQMDVSSVGRALHRYRKGHGFSSRTGLNFFPGLNSTTSSVVLLLLSLLLWLTPHSTLQLP